MRHGFFFHLSVSIFSPYQTRLPMRPESKSRFTHRMSPHFPTSWALGCPRASKRLSLVRSKGYKYRTCLFAWSTWFSCMLTRHWLLLSLNGMHWFVPLPGCSNLLRHHSSSAFSDVPLLSLAAVFIIFIILVTIIAMNYIAVVIH